MADETGDPTTVTPQQPSAVSSHHPTSLPPAVQPHSHPLQSPPLPSLALSPMPTVLYPGSHTNSIARTPRAPSPSQPKQNNPPRARAHAQHSTLHGRDPCPLLPPRLLVSTAGTNRLPFSLRAPAPHLHPAVLAVPAGTSYMAAMGRGRRFAYHKLKKLPPAPSTLDQHDHDHDHQQPPPAAAIEESYHSYYRALGAAAAAKRRQRQWQRVRPRRRRLRISGLARALRRKAAAVGGRVRASVAKVARRLREGRPYIGDLFAGNYMFLQVAPSPTMVADGKPAGFPPFAEYYYGKQLARIKPPAAAALQLMHTAAAAGVLYNV